MSRGVKLLLTALVVVVATALPLLAGLTGNSPARDDAFRIDEFVRDVTLTPDGRVEVTETIEVTFTEPRRGIFRDLEPDGPAGSVRYQVEGVDRGDPSEAWDWTLETADGGDHRIRIGDAATVLEPGPQSYRLVYAIDGLLFRPDDRPDQVQLRLDVPGDAWPVDVTTTTLTVSLPAAPTRVDCVVGTSGAATPCPDATMSGTTVTQTLPALGPTESGTVAIELPASAVTGDHPEVEVTELTTRGAGRAPIEVPTVPGILAMLALVAAPALVLEWFRAGRVYRDQVTDPALHDRVAPTAELEPPDGLAPVELAAVDRVGGFLTSSDSEVLLATLIDLEIRGVIISSGGHDEDGDPLTFGPGPASAEVRDFERDALEALMPGGSPLTFDGEYDRDTSERSSAGTSRLVGHAGQLFRSGSRYVHSAGGALRGGGYVLGIAGAVLAGGLVGLVAMQVFGVPAIAVVVTWVALAIAWLVLALIWRAERRPLTSEGRDVVARTRAFEHFLAEVHADRLTFAASRPDVSVTHPAVALLPYAVVLGLGASWLERFEPVLVEAARTGTAGAASGSNPWFLHPTSFAAASTLHSSSVTSPSSSGGGSFGGGGAGSGGGGGGGGSW